MTAEDVENALFYQRVWQSAKQMGMGTHLFIECFYPAELRKDYWNGSRLLETHSLVTLSVVPFNQLVLDQLKAQYKTDCPWISEGNTYYTLALK